MKRTSILLVGLLALIGCTSKHGTSAASFKDSEHPARIPSPTNPIVVQGANIQPVSLRTYNGCDDFLRTVRNEAARHVTAYGLDGDAGPMVFGSPMMMPAMAQASSAGTTNAATPDSAGTVPDAAKDFSTTNVQEAGIDEPDMVKNDGDRIFALDDGRLYAVTLRGARPAIAGELKLKDQSAFSMFLAGDRVLLFSNDWSPAPRMRPWFGDAHVVMSVVDVSDLGAMHVLSTLSVEGSFVDARMINGIARVVVRSNPSGMAFTYPTTSTRTAERRAISVNRRAVVRSRLDDWLPNYELRTHGDVHRGLVGDCASLYHPRVFSGLGTLSVLTIDPAHPGAESATSLLAGADTVYATARSLYVATNRWVEPSVAPAARRVMDAAYTTEIHRFDISDPTGAPYRASGSVRGHLLNSYSISEHGDDVRVATTDGAPWGTSTQSGVTVLHDTGAALVPIGHVGGLGRGERIQAVRFLGDRAYVVTFRQTDPFYVVDLADPAKPTLTAELKLPGFSSYLHPVDENRILGIGQGPAAHGEASGLQLSLFDVSDPAAPKRIANHVIANAWSGAQGDPHAFLSWPAEDLVVVPLADWRGPDGFVGAGAFRLSPDGIEEVGRVAHPDATEQDFGAQITRSLVVRDALYTVSHRGLLASDLKTFVSRSWLAWSPTFSWMQTYAGSSAGSADGEGWQARFDAPGQMAAGDRGIYVVDRGNKRIAFIDEQRRVRTIGGGSFLPAEPTGIARAHDGSLFVATACAVWKVRTPLTDPKRELVAGPIDAERGCDTPGDASAIPPRDGSGATARFGFLAQIAIAPDGSIVAADAGAHAIRRISIRGSDVTVATIAGTLGTPGFADGHDARFDTPTSVIILPTGTMLVADSKNHVVRHVEGDGTVSTFAGKPGNAGDDATRLSVPTAIAYDTVTGAVFVTEGTGTHGSGDRIRMIRRGAIDDLTFQSEWFGRQPRHLASPGAVMMSHGSLLIADTGNHVVEMLYRN